MLMVREVEMEDFPPGYRFYPTEEELASFYLSNKVDGRRQNLISIMRRIIPDLDIYEFNPWDLPQFSGEVSHRDPEQWFFFVPRQEVEARGGRPKRLTTTGYWKATGSPGHVYSSTNRTVGMKRTMVFYKGRAPKGTKTQWKMNEYKLMEGDNSSSSSLSYPRLREEFSLCRVYQKSKCLRAFDRRPVGVEIMMGEPRPNYEDQQAHDNDDHSPPLMLDNFITSSPNNVSFQGDRQNYGPSQTNWDRNVITTAASNNETALDWEMLAEWEGMLK